VVPAGASPTFRIYLDGWLALSGTDNYQLSTNPWRVRCGATTAGNPSNDIKFDFIRFKIGEVYNGLLTAPWQFATSSFRLRERPSAEHAPQWPARFKALPFPSTIEAMHRYAQEQCAFIRDILPGQEPGGRLIVAEIACEGMTIRATCDLWKWRPEVVRAED
jgi:hypothetical protein